jgi:hypothetical protein
MNSKTDLRYINFLAEMVDTDKNPSEAQQLQLQKEKKIIVHSLRGQISTCIQPLGSDVHLFKFSETKS